MNLKDFVLKDTNLDNIERMYHPEMKSFSLWRIFDDNDNDYLERLHKYMPNLNSLDIDLIGFKGPIDDLSLFTNLTEMRVSFCDEFPESISKLTKLVKFWTHNEGPIILPKSFSSLPNLKEVYYSVDGNIVDLTPIFNNPNVEILETACVHVDSFVGIDKMKNLKLYKQGIYSEELSTEIFKSQSLEIFHIDEIDNDYPYKFPEEINNAPNLKKIIVDRHYCIIYFPKLRDDIEIVCNDYKCKIQH